MSNEMMTVPQWDLQHTAANYRMATDVAGLCREIVVKSCINIAGKKYVRAEGWQAIATAHGCVGSARDVERVEGGIRAVGEVRKVSDGIVIATAEGFVGDDEPMWQKRPEYAKRAMCQTRAISRACRSAFAHVVVLMDAGLSTTPAEEVPDGGFKDTSGFMDTNGENNVTGDGIPPKPRKYTLTSAQRATPNSSVPHGQAPVDVVPKEYWDLPREERAAWIEKTYGLGHTVKKIEKDWRVVKAISETAVKEKMAGDFEDRHGWSAETNTPEHTESDTISERNSLAQGWQDVVVHFGKNKGVRLGDLDKGQLKWYREQWEPRPFRGRISDEDNALRAALDESMGRAPKPSQQEHEEEESAPF